MNRDQWTIRIRYLGGWRPWHAFITQGIGRLGEPGSGTYASRTPEAALRKAMKTVAKIAPNEHPNQIVVDVVVDRGWA